MANKNKDDTYEIDQTYEGKNKEIMKDLEKDGWAMTPFVDRADYFKEQGYDVENKGGVYMIKPKPENSMSVKSQKEEIKDEIDTDDNGKIEKDEMADFQKSLDDYAAKNKKGRDDIPVTTRR